ncbi:lipopolysaccharide ABC transporter permease LptG [Aliidiomarina iranensis]|uniref:Lipopolysaccharide ABC transporter permease LptG n=1 Tax=Aliidiomarina iranensis TaxID=1434071 RepID=A0A432VU66_9GAMM|nr:LPS export ABC transporter permease LptG [Aliidiomarina iranensis]RUO20017.1 lipopolysaccharide ABC transporter permease LptG [Aliidiomarina iranensis]
MFSILDKYIGKTVLFTSLMSLLVLTGLSSLIRFVEQIRAIGRGTYEMSDVLVFVLLSIPRDVEVFFPMAALLGGLIGMGLLASSSELTVMMGAGLSRLNIIGSVMKSAVIMMFAVLAIGEWVAPTTEANARQLRAQAVSGGSLISGEQGIWAKDGERFIHIGEVLDTGTLENVTIYEFNDRELEKVVHGGRATYVGPDWFVNDAQYTEVSAERVVNYQLASWSWRSTLTPDKLGAVTVRPESLSISGLNDYVNYLKSNRQDASRYELAFWRKVVVPFTVAVMLLVALSFVFGPLRSTTMGARVLLGVITGFTFHVFNEIFAPVSQVYNLPPLLGALLPGMLFASVALYILSRDRI